MSEGPRWETYADDESGLLFLFKTDTDDPAMLHIYARHLTRPEDAIETFFAAAPEWNERYQRHETYSATHGLYWTWARPNRVVRVITCFRLEE